MIPSEVRRSSVEHLGQAGVGLQQQTEGEDALIVDAAHRLGGVGCGYVLLRDHGVSLTRSLLSK